MATTTIAQIIIDLDTFKDDTNSTTDTENGERFNFSVDAEMYWYFRLINYAILGQAFAIFGIVTNVINTAMFIKMGFKDPINASLLGLSISDLFSCLTMVWSYLIRSPGFMELDLPFEPIGTGYITATWPHLIFVKITSGITAFITFERCLCVTFPLKIKNIITTKRVAIITVGIYVLVFAIASPMFYVNRLARFPNTTITGLVFTKERDEIEPIILALFGTVLPSIAFLTTIIFTVVLVQTLKKNAAWRNKATGTTTTKTNSGPSRDVKVARMVVLISTLFIVCFSPVMILTFVIVLLPEFRKGGAYEFSTSIVFSFIYLLEITNASLNIFVYYYRSSNYKTMFDKTFRTNAEAG